VEKFTVYWSKTYYVSGQEEVEADSIEQAEEQVWETLGDKTGSMQYNPDDDYVEAISSEL
jgi:hypothetical protein